MRSAFLPFLGVSLILSAPARAEELDLVLAKAVYEQNCARCHGATGQGDGMDAKRMSPMPRNLADGIFKFRTTASGTPPTDQDLFRTISTGLPGSRMPDFQRLSEETRWQLVGYVKTLSPIFEQQKPEPIDLGKDPGPKGANLPKGKELYAQLGCAACHGPQGRGDGPSAPTLVDNWNRPIRAADLTQGWSYRGGSTPREIVARFLTGIDGTPMPSYADAISSKEDAWHLAYYVQSIQEKPNWGRTIRAKKVSGPLPTTGEDPAWGPAPRTDLRLSSNFYRQGLILPARVTAISVQALYNEGETRFRLGWNDTTESRENPPDAAALFLLPDRRQKFQVGSVRSWPAGPDAPPLDQVGWSAKETASGKESQAVYSEGRWTVLMKHPPVKSGSLAGFAVWDGGNGEQGRHRAASNWVDLVLE